jgi:hypothetical protein
MSEANGVPTVSVYLQNKIDEHRGSNPRASAMYRARKARVEADGLGNLLVTEFPEPDRLHPPFPYGGSEADSRREHNEVRAAVADIDRVRPQRP